MAFDRASDLAAAGEAELAVELAGVVEAKDVFGLFGEEVFGLGDESEEGVALYDVFKMRDAVGLGLDGFCARAFFLFASWL